MLNQFNNQITNQSDDQITNQSNKYYNKYLKYKQKYLQLKKQLGSGGIECLPNESKKIHEYTADFMQNYKQYTLSVCQHCDEYIYKIKDTTPKDTVTKTTTNQWSQNIQDIEIDQASLNSISNPMVKEVLEFILRKQNEIKEEKQKNMCKRIKNHYDLLMTTQRKLPRQTLFYTEINAIKKKYKLHKCDEISGKIQEINAN